MKPEEINDWQEVKDDDPGDWVEVKRPLERGIVADQFDALKGFGSYTAGSIPVLGPAVEKAAAGTAALFSGPEATKVPYANPYETFKGAHRQEREQYEAEHPTWAMGGALLGTAPLPVGPQWKAAEGMGALAKTGIAAANVASRTGTTAAQVATDALIEGKDPIEEGKKAGFGQLAMETAIGAIKGSAKVGARLMTGVRPETVAKYKARAPQINAADEEKIVNEVTAAQQKHFGEPVDDAVRAAQQAADDRRMAEMIELNRLEKVAPPAQMAPGIVDSLKAARKTVSEASSAGFKALEEANTPVNIAPWKTHIGERMNSLAIRGQVPPANRAEHEELGKWLEYLEGFENDELMPKDAKKFIQALDRAEEQAYAAAQQAGGYVSKQDRALMDLRRDISNDLKARFPEYQSAMAIASTEEKAIEKVQKLIGKEERDIARKLPNLDQYQREALEGLQPGSTQQLSELDRAREILNDRLRRKAHFEGLPESQAATEAAQSVQDLRAWNEPVKHLGKTQGAQSALRRIQSEVRPDLANKEALGILGEASGKDFLQSAEDLAVKRAFEQGFSRGSRNVNLGAFSVSGALGTAAKALGGSEATASGIGKAVGAVLGASADLVGPRVFKKWLDFSMQPGFQKYANVLNDAAQRGPKAVAVAHYILMKNDPNYAAIMQEESK